MKLNDKVLTAFLVSLGLFSAIQATQYVSSLSAKDKQALLTAAVETGELAVDPTGPRELVVKEANG